ncbi:MAG TPA: DNA primase [Bryobacteraceae bacterium]|jgi:DNA primase|nr:DNA primase [Bryobacteraceae bacterium]
MDFAQELKSRVDIVAVIGERVRLRKNGPNSYKGLCPFHTEKTPSFNVHADKQFYKCFGCSAGGDVLKFVMEMEGLTFFEALKELAERNGIAMPKRSHYADDESKLREALYQMHELAAETFRANLRSPAGETARAYLARRGLKPETVEQFGLGYSDRSGRALLRLFEQRGFSAAQIEQSGLISRRQEDASFYDYFRGRLMFPIHSETGKVIAFGGRGLSDEQVPKYLNSPTVQIRMPIYEKSRVLFNLHRAKEAIRKEDRAILVEGYMDVIGVYAAGFRGVVASCGTALTSEQVRAIKRHTDKIVVNFDPDAAGSNAAESKLPILLEEGLQVRLVELDGGLDPDEYCKERGAEAYKARLDSAKGYFHWLADRVRSQYDLRTTEGQVAVLKHLLPSVQRIHDTLERMQVANEIASYVGVEQRVVLDAFKKSVVDRNERPMQQPVENVRADEKGLLNVLLSTIEGRETLLDELPAIAVLQRLAGRRIFQAIVAIHQAGAPLDFDALNGRLEEADQRMLAVALLSSDEEGQEFTLEYGTQCLDSLRRSDRQDRVRELKRQVKDAERAGNLADALRLAAELQKAERRPDTAR